MRTEKDAPRGAKRARKPPRRAAAHQARVVDLRQGSRTQRYSVRPDRERGSRSVRRVAAVRASREES